MHLNFISNKLQNSKIAKSGFCPWASCSWGELQIHGASCPWGEFSIGRVVHGTSCPGGELSMGRVVHGANFYGAKFYGASFDEASCLWSEFRRGELSGNRSAHSPLHSLHSAVGSHTQCIFTRGCLSDFTMTCVLTSYSQPDGGFFLRKHLLPASWY
jgi:hypothetical protein